MTHRLPGSGAGAPAEVLEPRDRAYEAYDPADELPQLVREVDGWSVYRPGGRVARFVGPGSKRRALSFKQRLQRSRGQ